MSRIERREGPNTKWVLMVVVGIAALMLTVGIPASASAHDTFGSAHGKVITVLPNGVDDTADIQAAFDACTSYGQTCTVQLVKGTYYTAQIIVFGFQGSFVGGGPGSTVVQALPDLAPPDPAIMPFWAAAPGPGNLWPMLFLFENGTFQVSGMTISVPSSTPVPAGWYAPAVGTTTSLVAAIEITGLHAHVSVDHVAVVGAPGDQMGTNIMNAIMFEGSILPAGWTDPDADVFLLQGTFSVTHSVFDYVNSGPWFNGVTDSVAVVCDNTLVKSPVPLGFFDISNSQLLFCRNHISDVEYGVGVLGFQGLYPMDLQPSTVRFTGNVFDVSDGSVGFFLADFGEVSTLRTVVSGNLIETDTSCGCYDPSDPLDYSAIGLVDLASSLVSGNTIRGASAGGVFVMGGPATVQGNSIDGAYAGVWNRGATDVTVSGNRIWDSTYGVLAGMGSSTTITHNAFSGVGVGIAILGSSTATIARNTIDHVTDTGVAITIEGGSAATIEHNTVLGSTTSAANGIWVTDGSTATIAYNVIGNAECANDAELVAAGACGPNFVTDYQFPGIGAFGSGTVIVAHNLIYNTDIGVQLVGCAPDCVVRDNVITNSYDFGLAGVDGIYSFGPNVIRGGAYGVAAIAYSVDTTVTLSHVTIVGTSVAPFYYETDFAGGTPTIIET